MCNSGRAMAVRSGLCLLVSSLTLMPLACASLSDRHGQLKTTESRVLTHFSPTPPIPETSIVPTKEHLAVTSTTSSYDKNDNSLDSVIIHEIMSVVQKVSVSYRVVGPNYQVPGYEMTGSAIILAGENGVRYALTNNHLTPHNADICDDWRTAYRVTVGEKEGRVVYRDCRHDLAVIKLEDKSLSFYNRCLGASVAAGDYIAGAGFGLSGPKSFVEGKVRAVTKDETLFHYNGTIVHGDSGAPLFAVKKQCPWLVGLATFMVTDDGDIAGIGAAVGSTALRKILAEYREGGVKPLQHYVAGNCSE